MPTPVDVGDAATSLQESRAAATATAKAISGGALTTNEDASGQALPAPPPLKIGRAPQVKPSKGLGPPAAALTAPDVNQPNDADSLPHANFNPPPPPPPADAAPEEGAGDYWNAQNFMHFVRDAAKGTGQEVADIAPRVGAQMLLLFGRGAAGISTIADKEIDGLNDAWGAMTGGKTNHLANADSRLADASFKFVDDYLKPAVDRFTPERSQVTGQGPGSGGLAQAIGSGGEAAPYMAMGHAGIIPMLANASTQSMYDQIDQGQDVKTAFASGTIDGIANYIQAKFGVIPGLPALKRIITAIPLGDLMKVSADYAKKLVLHSMGSDDAANKIDPTANLGEASVTNAIFGALGGHGKSPEKGGAPPPPPEATIPDAGAAPPGPAGDPNATPPAPPAATTGTASPAQGAAVPAPVAASKVPDMPSIESSKDLRAQVQDMNNKETPRVGVLITKDSLTSLVGSKDANALSVNGTLNQARSQDRTIVLPQGELMLKSAKIAAATKARLAAGEDPQTVIGQVTGAGDGKSPDQTVVVQGHTPDGAVATESMVAPDAAHMAVQKVIDQGKTPVVTTPEAAIQRRVDEISKERNTPTQQGIMTDPVSGKEVAVHILPSDGDSMMKVQILDENGDPQTKVRVVDPKSVKVGAPGVTESSGGPRADTGEAKQPPVSQSQKAGVASPEESAPPTSSAPGFSPGESGKGAEAAARRAAKNDERRVTPNDTDNTRRIGDEPQDMTLTKEQRAQRRAEVAMARDKAEGKSGEMEPEPIPANAANVEGEAAKRAAMTDEQRAAYDKANALPSTGETAEQVQTRLSAEADARGKDIGGRVGDQPAPKLKANKIETALEALPKALETHEQQEQIPDGKKFPASLPDRQENASLFAKILKSAADSASGKTEPAAIERAIKAAKAAERLADKGKEETAKGQGTSHVRTTALVAEMHKAARGLLGKAREGDNEVVKPKEAELKAKAERTRARIVQKAKVEAAIAHNREAGTAPAERAPKPAKPVEKPEVQVQRDASRLMDRYIHADEDDIKGVHAEMEQFLHEHMSDKYTPDEIKDVLHLMHEQRIEQNPDAAKGPRRMSDTLEDETTGLDTSAKGLKTLGLRSASKHALQFVSNKMEALKGAAFESKLGNQYKDLASHMAKNGGFTDLISRQDTGQALSTHKLLDMMLSHAQGTELHGLLSNLRAHVPDLPVHSVSDIVDLRTGSAFKLPASGVFDRKYNSIQVVPNRSNAAATVRTMVHEMVHAATSYELQSNPHGLLGSALENARQVLLGRMRAAYGNDTIQQHIDYFTGKGARPENFNRALYGLANTEEMLAELHVNHEFVNEIANSEKFAQPGEQFNDTLLGTGKTLLHKIYTAIGNFLGVRDPKLLQHIAGLSERTMDIQTRKTEPGQAYDRLGGRTAQDFEGQLVQAMREQFHSNPLEISRALPSFEEVARDPAPIPREEEIMRSIGEEDETKEVGATTRLFRQAMNSGIVDGARAVKISLKTVPQIFRDGRRDFGGRDDPANPLNKLADVEAKKTKIIHDMSEISRPVAKAWMKLNDVDNKAVGSLLRDATMYKLDPRKGFADQGPEGKDDPKALARHQEFQARLQAMPEAAREVFGGALDASKNLARAERRANIDTALESFSDTPITDAQRTLLYGARRPEAYEDLVGDGKLIDVGENNDKLKQALGDFAGQSELNGPYAHLGRHGDYVVTAEPEGTRKFADEATARKFAKEVDDLSPDSKGTYALRGGEHQVDYKVQYTSFHETRNDAEAERQRMNDAGYKTGVVTRKTMSREDTPLSAGTRDLVAAAESKINRNGKSTGNDALIAGLRSAFLQLAAQRSAYAGSRMARKNFAGVKPEEMRRNFADHAQSTIWHTAQLRTTFEHAAALARLRDMARDADADQPTAYRRGEVVDALNKHLKDEVSNFGHKSALNTGLARLGFMSYLASPSHAMIWMTQNFTTGIPVAGARWGYGKASSSFLSAMKLVSSPALRTTVHAIFGKAGGADEVNQAILDAVKKDKRFGKWAQGENSHMQQLIDHGVLGHSYSNELHEMAQSGKSVLGVPATVVNRAFEWARLLPNMADSWNRVSTALAGLEMTGGDIRKTSDFIDEVHADYSSGAKPLLFKKIGRVPGANSVTMFKTYTQSMIHLFYGNLKNAMIGGGADRMESAKTAAGMVIANSLFAGVYGAAAIEPLRLAVYAYHKLFDQEGEVYDLKNAIHRFLVDHLGHSAGNIAAGGLPHIAGMDLSSRMGLADLFFHEPPDLFSADKEAWKNFAYNEAGPMLSFLAERTTNFVGHMQRGEAFQAVSSLVPVKMYQDAIKAAELLNTGKKNSLGGQMTQPSAVDAATQLFGIKPSSVADAQERATTKVNYNAEVKATRESILKAYVSSNGADRAAAQTRINSFNKLHPAEAIKPTDQIKMMRYRQESQTDQPGRDVQLNKMLKY